MSFSLMGAWPAGLASMWGVRMPLAELVLPPKAPLTHRLRLPLTNLSTLLELATVFG